MVQSEEVVKCSSEPREEVGQRKVGHEVYGIVLFPAPSLRPGLLGCEQAAVTEPSVTVPSPPQTVFHSTICHIKSFTL